MESYKLLSEFVILLAVCIPVIFIFQKLKVPTIVGFLVTGVIVGPTGFGLISEVEIVKSVAELGVVLLLFTIGLEFSLRELILFGPRLIFAGAAQVLLSIGVVALVGRMFHLSTSLAIFLGFLFSLSSTAIVLKIFADRAELSTPQARTATVVLLFQDLCVIPMMLLFPVLSGGAFDPMRVLTQMGLAVLTLVGLVVGARYLVPLLLKHVVALRNRDLFLFAVLFICLGTAAVSAQMGLSLAIGAFIAGIVISESAYSHQIMSDILPLRDIFNAIFFISVGMLVDLHVLASQWQWNVLLAGLTITVKTLILFCVLLVAGNSPRVSIITAFSLCQVGEFSFLLAGQGERSGLLPPALNQLFLASSVMTMILTPAAISVSGALGLKLQRLYPGKTGAETESPAPAKDHLLIVGFGLNGQNLSRVVREAGLSFVVVELNDRLVQLARNQEINVLFGDATRREVLLKANATHARMAVIAISDAAATRHCVAILRELSASLKILVRTRYIAEVDSLIKLGASLVIPEEFETSIEIFARVLQEYNIPNYLIDQQISIVRSDSYGMLRGLSLSHERLLQISQLLLRSTIEQIVLSANSPARGKSIRELEFRKRTGVSIIAVIRQEQSFPNPDPDFVLQEEDILVLWGAHKQLAEALMLFK